MLIRVKGKNPKKNKQLQAALGPVQLQAENLLQDEPTPAFSENTSFTEGELITMLENGEFVYWGLERNELDQIIRVNPYSMDRVIENLYRETQFIKVIKDTEDVLYDFTSRL